MGSTKVPFSYPEKIYYLVFGELVNVATSEIYTSNHILPLSSEILNATNFMWTVVVGEAWMGMYQDLVDYSKKKNGGSTKIPFSYPEKSTTFLLGQNVNVYTS